MLGRHYLIDYFDCHVDAIDDAPVLELKLATLIRDNGGTVLGSRFHKFSPQGVTGVVLIAESHCAIHTWPEHGQACVDLFSCGDRLNALGLAEKLKDLLQAKEMRVATHIRGRLETSKEVERQRVGQFNSSN